MRNYLCLFLILIPCFANAQWDLIHKGSDLGGEIDLYFLNSDSGFVIGGNASGSFVLRTHDGGTSWDSLWYDSYQFSSIHFPSADTGYIACFYLVNYPSFDVLRTIDGGDSWQHVAVSIGQASGIPYAISFFDNNTGVINLQTFTAKTTDAGITWSQLDVFEGGFRDGDIGNEVFIQMGGRLIVWTSDRGNTFSIDTLNYQGSHYFLKARDSRFISSSIGSHGQDLGYPNYSFGIIVIGDVLTRNWNISYFPEFSRVYGVSWPSENILYAVHRSIYSEGDNAKFFMKSIDGGDTWYRQATTEPGYYGTQVIFCPNDTVCYAIAGYGNRIYKTTNGGGPLLDQVEQVVVSVKEIEDDLNFSIAPNPTSGQVTIRSETELIKEVKVFDLQGKELLRSYPNDFNVLVDLSKYDSGVYLIQIMAGDKIRTGKIVKE